MATPAEIIPAAESPEVAPQESAPEIQETHAPATVEAVDDVKKSAHALIEALQGLAQAEFQSATDMTQDTYHNIEQAVKSLRERADQGLQTATHQVEDFDARLINAAKAAWKVLSTRSSDSESNS